ncbi:MAG: antibiotic biosynthesis monooxygenase [Gammaproteobacteria bacterium]|nr:antibiotic biosynthesis monooxygenase [Gammaproteobacteria bacterium]MBQ0838333.1 antibiotic biosynthesis monooxygenase [Gammaproteobacteria bacterium]
MLGVIATLTIQDGKQEGFEALMRDLAAQVKAKEPDCTFYELNKTDDATVYVMMEQYTDQAAFDAHGKTPHFQELGGRLGEFLGAAPDIKIMQGVN